MTVFWFCVIVLAFLWVALSALPAGVEAHMPMPYMIALTPFLWIPLALLAALAAWRHDWTALCCLLVIAFLASSQRLSFWGTSTKPLAQRHETNRETGRETQSATADNPHCQADSLTVDNSNTDDEDSADNTTAPSNPNRETVRETLPARFTVMTVNCRYGRADASDIVSHVRERSVDVLALQEVTTGLIARLDEAGLGEALPHRQLGEAQKTDNGGFNAIFSRVRPGAQVPNIVEIPAADVPAITLRLTDAPITGANHEAFPHTHAGNSPSTSSTNCNSAETTATDHSTVSLSKEPSACTITFASAHPKSPMRGCPEWSAGILGLAALAQAQSVDNRNIAVVMGDLNSSTDHPSFRALLKGGFADASLAQGTGPHTTFPSWLPWPRIELDHVLFTPGLKTDGVQSFTINGTDHLALACTLRLPGSR